MVFTRNAFRGGVLSIVMALAAAQPLRAQSGGESDYEVPLDTTARVLLPGAGSLSNNAYRVMDNAEADGMLYSFSMWTPSGWYRPQSLAMLRVRMSEAVALASLNSMRDDPLFVEGVVDSARGTARSAVGAVARPVQTLRSIPMGLEKFARSAQARADEGPVRNESGGYLNQAAKRKLAFSLGVDPYTDNPQLQEALNTITAHKNSGALATRIATAFAPGGVGVAIKAASVSKNLHARLRDNSGAELMKMNRAALAALGCTPSQISALLEGKGYTVTHTTVITDAMTALASVQGIGNYASFVRNASAPEVALFQQQQIQMAANFHRTQRQLARFGVAGGAAVFTDRQGERHIFAPVDIVAWDRSLHERLKNMGAGRKDAPKMNFWITGTATTKAMERLAAYGVTVHEKAGSQLLAVND